MSEVWVGTGIARPWDRLLAKARSIGRWASVRPEALFLFSLAIGYYGISKVDQATPNGLGLIGDSFYYVTGAENLAAGRGFGRLRGGGEFAPTTHYPPGYSLAMAGFQVLGIDKLESARWVNLGSYVVLILSLAFLLRRATGSNVAGVLAGLFLGLSPVLLQVHAWVMSEALYLALSAVAMLLLSLYFENGRRTPLGLLAVLVGAAYLTRYVGIALTASIGLALALQRGPRRRKLVDFTLFLAIALAPMLLWLIRNALLSGNLANRDILWNPVGYDQLRTFGLHVIRWFGPTQLVRGKLGAAFVFALLGGVGTLLALDLWKAGRLRLRNSEESAFVWYALFYVAALGVSISLFDAFIPIDDRILSPLYVTTMVLVALLVVRGLERLRAPLKVLLLLGLGLMLGWNAVDQAWEANELSKQVLGYANPAIGQSELIKAVRDLPAVPIVSNGLSSLYFWADRYSYAIPVRIDVESGLPRENYEAEMELYRRRFREQDAVLVLFRPETLLPDYAPLRDLIDGLTLVARYSDGEIYRYESSSAEPSG